MKTYEEKINEKFDADVKSGTVKLHHTSSSRGYMSRKIDRVVTEYKGRFGKGYAVYTPRWDTTSYCTITYYV